MKLSSQIDLSSLDVLADEIEEAAASALIQIGSEAIALMRQRIDQGYGLDDQPMLAYSESYKRTREREGLVTDRRVLLRTGLMLGDLHIESISIETGEIEVTIGLATGEGRQKALHTHKQSPWFGLSKSDQNILSELLQRRLDAEI